MSLNENQEEGFQPGWKPFYQHTGILPPKIGLIIKNMLNSLKFNLMPSKKNTMPLMCDHYYHIYNRGNNKEKIFVSDADYKYFIKQFKKIIAPYVTTYAFGLLPNHFHLLVKINDDPIFHGKIKPSDLFRNFFQSYSQYFNNTWNRTGSLFSKCYKRLEVNNDDYLKRLVFYIHYNPTHHNYVSAFDRYRFSSFICFIKPVKSLISIDYQEVLSWFNNDLNEFIEYHKMLSNDLEIQALKMEL